MDDIKLYSKLIELPDELKIIGIGACICGNVIPDTPYE